MKTSGIGDESWRTRFYFSLAITATIFCFQAQSVQGDALTHFVHQPHISNSEYPFVIMKCSYSYNINKWEQDLTATFSTATHSHGHLAIRLNNVTKCPFEPSFGQISAILLLTQHSINLTKLLLITGTSIPFHNEKVDIPFCVKYLRPFSNPDVKCIVV